MSLILATIPSRNAEVPEIDIARLDDGVLRLQQGDQWIAMDEQMVQALVEFLAA